ncbi:hypothetical protein ACIBSW_27665 [Actinoplanes sp. NPDC049668]|uniref:hypothetical protein n=1 Tax=unclassified Actinoplanes TaxID=2626549 RepID=UPI0033A2DB76
MTLADSLLLIGGGAGLLLAVFGAAMLVTGKAPAVTLRNFTRVRAAGMYHLLFGVALVLMVLNLLTGATLVITVLAVALVVVAVVRYRPRRSKPGDEG